MKEKGNKLPFLLVCLAAATTLIVLTPEDGFEITIGKVKKIHTKIFVAVCALFMSYRLLRSPKKKVKPAILFSDNLKMKAMLVKSYGTHPMEMGSTARPRVSKPHDVLIRVRAASLNPIDFRVKEGYGKDMLAKIRNKCGFSNDLPIVVGRDCSGEVVEVGEFVNKFKPGDEVWTSSTLFNSSGTLAEYFLAVDSDVSLKPKNMTHEQAASLPYVINTSGEALRTAGMNPTSAEGKRALVLAGTGGIGSYVIQLLKAWGCHVTTTCSVDGFKMVQSLGADDVIDYKKEPLVSAMKGKEKFDFIFCTRGGDDTYASCLAVCRSGGTVVTIVTPVIRNLDRYGFIVGSLMNVIYRIKFTVRQKLLYGKTFCSSFHENNGTRLGVIAELVENGKIRACIDSTYSLIDANEGLNRLKEGHARGKMVITIPDDDDDQ